MAGVNSRRKLTDRRIKRSFNSLIRRPYAVAEQHALGFSNSLSLTGMSAAGGPEGQGRRPDSLGRSRTRCPRAPEATRRGGTRPIRSPVRPRRTARASPSPGGTSSSFSQINLGVSVAAPTTARRPVTALHPGRRATRAAVRGTRPRCRIRPKMSRGVTTSGPIVTPPIGHQADKGIFLTSTNHPGVQIHTFCINCDQPPGSTHELPRVSGRPRGHA